MAQDNTAHLWVFFAGIKDALTKFSLQKDKTENRIQVTSRALNS